MKRLVLTLFFFLAITSSAFGEPSDLSSLKAESIAKAETLAWQAFTQNDQAQVLQDMEEEYYLLYGLTKPQATELTKLYLVAEKAMENMPAGTPVNDFTKEVQPALLAFYQLLNQAHPINNPEDAAKYQTLWWYQKWSNEAPNAGEIAHTMSQMYIAIYGDKNTNQLERAAYFRAIASQYRNLCNRRWGGITVDDWYFIQNTLTQTYSILLLAQTSS